MAGRMKPPVTANPHRGFLKRKLRNLGIAYALGATVALLLGIAAARAQHKARGEDFTARGVEVPEDLREAVAARDAEKIRRAAERSPAAALRVIVDRPVGLPGLSDQDYEQVLDAAAPALPLKSILDDLSKIFLQGRGLGVRPSDLREQRAALKILERSPDPMAVEALERASWLPRDRDIEEEAKRILEVRKRRNGRPDLKAPAAAPEAARDAGGSLRRSSRGPGSSP